MGFWNLFNEPIGDSVEADLFFIEDEGLWPIDKAYAEYGEAQGFLLHIRTRRDLLDRITYTYKVTGQ